MKIRDQKILLELNDNLRINVKKGLAKALLPQELEKLRKYDLRATGARDYDVAYNERIKIPLEMGGLFVKIPDGSIKFDDRKLRFSGLSFDDRVPTIYIAPSTFTEMNDCDNPAAFNKQFFDELIRMGIRNYNDPFAYFSCCFAVNAIPITNDNILHVFKRGMNTATYPGYWHVIGGMLDADFELFEGDPGEKLLSQTKLGIKKEYSEETGVNNGEFRLIGLTRSIPGTVDFSYIANLPINSREFLDSMSKAQDSQDHCDYRAFKSKQELKIFLNQTQNILPVGRGSLELYLK